MAKRSNSGWGLIGIPDHEGVVNVGGRVGAAGGPKAFRRVFSRMRGEARVHESLCVDLDLSSISADIAATHRAAARAIEDAHHRAAVTVVVGGGNDHSFPQLVGVRAAAGKDARLGCINVDAHLDLRAFTPRITSGSPFRMAIENGVLEPSRLIEFGIQAHCNSAELWEYARSKKIPIVPFERLRAGRAVVEFRKALKSLASRCDRVVVSLDLDAVAQGDAPGVSAPQAEGFTAGELVQMAELAGENRKVASLGIFELNPEHDRDDRTARLAATAAWHFISSASRRR